MRSPLQNAQGASQQGQWRITDDGQLHVRFDGDAGADEFVTPITVNGNALTLNFAGQAITLQRSP